MFGRPTPRTLLLAGLTLTSIFAFTACGGGSDSASPETTAASIVDSVAASPTTVAGLTGAELVAMVDAVCVQVRTDMDAVAAELDGAPDQMLRALLEISQQGVVDLQAMPVAGAEATTLGELITMLDAADGGLVSAIEAIEAGDEAAMTAGTDTYGMKLGEFGAAAEAAGFSACGVGASEPTAEPTVAETVAPVEETADQVGGLTIVNLSEEVNPIDGFTFAQFPAEVEQELAAGFTSTPEFVEAIAAFGMTQVVGELETGMLMLFATTHPLVGDELIAFVNGVVGESAVEEIEVAGTTGWGFIDQSGNESFVTVRNDTVVLATAPSVETLQLILLGLFDANPNL